MKLQMKLEMEMEAEEQHNDNDNNNNNDDDDDDNDAAASDDDYDDMVIAASLDYTTTSMVWDQTKNIPNLKMSQDIDILVLSCVKPTEYEVNLRTLSSMLNYMRHVPIWLDICDDGLAIKKPFINLAENILILCWELRMPNVILTPSEFLISGEIYAYQPFPIFDLLSLIYHNALQLFPYKLSNLYGYNIRTIADLNEPFTIARRDANGELVMSGMLWQMLMEFARHLNGTLQLIIEPREYVGYGRLQQYVRNGSMDIAASVNVIVHYPNRAFFEYAYPMDIGSWCTMLPIERIISSHEAIGKAGLRIMGMKAEFRWYPNEMKIKYASSILLTDDFNTLMQLRSSFNTSYGYTLTSMKWLLFQGQQNYFKKPLFRYSNDLCMQKLTFFALLMNENCLYRDELDKFTLYLSEHGFLQFWNQKIFSDMLEANLLRLADLSMPLEAQPISWDEWLHVSALYGIGLLIGIVIFSVELSIYYFNVFLDNL
ncbi:uncharacterized protein Ir94f [Drosophila tropicalis]|uniref:uncharacterized protein Ir94f n=1 Tax=Drosophila tropicalis TaxID=46794 RepID=UPI0035AC0DCA